MKKYEQSLGDVLKDMVNKSAKMKKNITQTRISNLWNSMMGKTISQYTKSIYFRDGKLFINIEAASLREELAYGKEKIKKMLNEELGEAAIKEVIIR